MMPPIPYEIEPAPETRTAGRLVPAHEQTRTLIEVQYFQTHDHRAKSGQYARVHHHLVYELDEPCWICGVRQSQLPKGQHNETHHDELEWALANNVDPSKILADFPEMGAADDEHLRAWLDSESNMLVLCSTHHRSPYFGIHMVTYPPWKAQRWARLGTPVLVAPKD